MQGDFNFSKKHSGEPFGEVVESQISKLVIECWDYKNVPDFADLIEIKCPWGQVFGCVVGMKTGPIHSSRQPFAYRLSFEQLSIQQPQVLKLIGTWIEVKIFAYRLDGEVLQEPIFGLPPKLCMIHSFACPVSADEFVKFCLKPMFFTKLLGGLDGDFDIDQLAKSLILRLSKLKKLDFQFFESFYEQYCNVSGVDSRRIRLLLRDFEDILKSESLL